MVAPSPELLAVSRRWFKAVIDGGGFDLRDFVSESDDLRLLGTAPDENWRGQDVRDAVDAFFQEKPDVPHWEETFAEAFEDGALGWSLFVHRIAFAGRDGPPVEFRDTLIFALEKGAWRIIHRHGSIPVGNEQATGVTQRAITELAEAAREGGALAQVEGLASVMFTDVVESSVLASALGDRRWSQAINAHFEMVRGIVERHGGQFVKSLGDGAMSAFSSARSAMWAAADVQRTLADEAAEPRLSVRIGVHAGDVVQTREDFFGNVVNVAARIASAAGRGEVFVSDVARALAGDDLDLPFEALGAHALAGQAAPSQLHALKWRR